MARSVGLGTIIFFRLFQIFGTVVVCTTIVANIIRHPIKTFTKKRRAIPPAVLLDPSLGRHEYITANGLRFHYVTTGDKSKPLMLLVHGFPEFWYSWRYQLKEFSQDYYVVAVDMRGYGETEKPSECKQYGVEHLVEDIVQLIRVLSSDGNCILVAHDWGGAIAWNVASSHPEIVNNLVIMNCPHSKVMSKFLQSNWKQVLKSWYMFMFQTPWLPEIIFSLNDYGLLKSAYRGQRTGLRNLENCSEEDIEAYKYTFCQKHALTPPINYYRNIFNGNKMPGNIQVPTLLIWGEEDAYLDVALVEPHKKVCTDLTIHCIPNCSHWVQQDCPQQANDYIRQFLNRHR